MKTRIKYFVIISAVFLVLGCGKSSSVNPLSQCNRNLEDYSAQVTKFSSNPNKANCEALVNSLDKIIDNCAEISAVQRAEYRENRNDIDCGTFSN